MRLKILLCAAGAMLFAPAAFAQESNPGYFIPPQPKAAQAPTRSSGPHVRTARPLPVQSVPLTDADQGGDNGEPPQTPAANLPQPPVPTLGVLPKAPPPPPLVLAVLGVPDVMQQSNAAQIIQHVIGARREKLRAEVERTEATWRDLEQRLQNDASHLTPDQGRARERDLRDRIARDRRELQDKNRIIQEAAQVGLNQIERTLSIIVQRVAESHGINMVLHHSSVVLNTPPFDITPECTAELNKLLPTVQIPPENVDPSTLPKDWGSKTAATPAKASK